MEGVASFPACAPGGGLGCNYGPASGPSSFIYGFMDSAQPGTQRPAPGFAVKNLRSLRQVILICLIFVEKVWTRLSPGPFPLF